ncbi:hypothetical protein SMMN14_04237 [Sphaerulina musiva]
MQPWPGSRGWTSGNPSQYRGPHDYKYPGRTVFLAGYNLDSAIAQHSPGTNRFQGRAGQLWYGNAQKSFMSMQRPGPGGYAGGYF